MIVYFAGVNQIHFCEQFVGRHVLESFADSRPLYGRYRAAFASMVLDSGAYTEMTTGEAIDIAAYADFCAEHGEFYEWMASLDSIEGGIETNLSNLRWLMDRGLSVVPTYHQREPLSALVDYCKDFDRIALGFRRVNKRIVNAKPFLDEAFSNIPSHIKVHGFAMTSYTAEYPFESVDSRTWGHELLALRSCQTTQQGEPFAHLVDSELIEIIQKRYDRLPRMKQWQARPYSKQVGLFKEIA